MSQLNLLGISGALRKASTNAMLLQEAARLAGADQLVIADLHLPLYDGDLEKAEGLPAKVSALARQITEADAVLISTPEYNQGISGVLKNALDWVSRTEGKPWAGKPVAIMSAAAGRAGGARAQYALRLAMQPFAARLIPAPEVLVAANSQQFDEAGRLKDDRYLSALTHLMETLKAEVELLRQSV